MHNLVSTYRIQFHKGFTFEDFTSTISYLKELGVQTVYASPVFAATPGSTHGYDGIDSHHINPEIGSEKQLRELSKKLQKENMFWLQDIVPNHMAFHSANNWLMDVLEKGQRSRYASFFDISQTSDLNNGRLMVPFLGAPLEELFHSGEVKINYKEHGFAFTYYDNHYPLSPESYIEILQTKEDTPQAVKKIISSIKDLQRVEDKEIFAKQWKEIRLQMGSLMKNSTVKDFVEECLNKINSSPEDLKRLSDLQAYRMCHWQETDKKINYRRFFTINGLICLNIQTQEVFDHYHSYIRTFLEEGIIQGLRIDHIDGLFDPTVYLENLRTMAGKDTHITVEKILEPGESLPQKWPIQGNTGYDFLSLANNLFTNSDSKKKFTDFYHKTTGIQEPIHELIHEKKAFILNENMAGELDNLYGLFSELNLAQGKDPDKEKMRFAIGEFLIQCPVYRFYDNQFPLDQQEAAAIRKILTRIRNQRKELSKTADLLEDILIINPQNGDKDFNQRALQFYQRLMQFSGPLMAKGVEDTLMYTYNRYLGNNEVGDSPETFGISPEEFHRKMQDRQSNHPYSINATATHDTKRGEDANARLNVLTDLADEWIKKVKTWKALNKKSKGKNGPDDNDEYFIYQALTGAYPIYSEEEKDFPERFKQYLIKALREGKKNSNWTSPNEAYEKATAEFALKLIDKKTPFWKTFLPFQQKIADFGIINSLSKVLLKFTCPGIPDVYQGTEFWDLSMVDPDNRRPVNFEKRQKLLKELERAASKGGDFLSDLWESRHDAGIKLWMIQTLLKERKESQALFTEGSYIPLVLKGKYKDHILAFARRLKNEWRIIAIPLHPAIICKQQKKDIQHLDWKDTRIELPGEAPEEWESTFSITKGKGAIYIGEVFNKLPFAYLKLNQSTGDRRAGILMHITSLPSPYGIGDLGSEAKKFADFLSRSRQSYWQLLPMNPTESGMGHSPYSSISSMAGNTLLISPEELVKDGLLDPEEIKKHQISSKETVNFTEAEKIKQVLLDKAYTKFSNGSSGELKLEFEEFCQNEAFWLNDFALYVVLKNEQKNKAWFQWPEKYKYRDKKALQQFEENYREPIRKIKWLQFIFSYQWKSLRKYCNNCGVELFGDLPFYVSYDSADVWANPDIFSLDKNGKALGIAGVPPDYFNADGQLWGMPVFRWDVLKKRKYDWWIQRLKKNMELYDILRLDHFRAFADYWEVPAGETTAKNGVWKLGPGIDFFNAIKKALGDLPFIAEDLGDINEGVHKLRDDLRLPGMKVLQFAFGDDLPGSIYIPHNYTANYVAYTGTHDNNTTRGWYRQDAGQTEKKNLEKYSGMAVKENNVHLVLARMAMASVAQTAILPLQDVLGLDEKSRMNMPASVEKNWFWRLLPGQLTKMHEELLREWTKMYNR